jgi:hypothetical protein
MNLRVLFSRKAGGVNVLRFRARPTDNVIHEDLVEHWRKLFNSGNPTVRNIAWKIAKYAIYQSGMKQSNISFFKYIPPEFFSEIVNNSLRQFDENLDDPSVLNVIFKNMWKDDVFVPKVRNPNQLVIIRNDKGDTIGYRLKKGHAANDRFYSVAVPPFLKLSAYGETSLMELVGFSGERQSGDAIYQLTGKLGDGTSLTEYHSGESIYEDNNEYVEGIESLEQYVNSSVAYWSATAPLTPPAIVENTGAAAETYADNEAPQTEDSQSEFKNIDPSMLSDDEFKDLGFSPPSGDKAQLTTQDTRKPDNQLDTLLRAKLAEIGVQVQDVDKIYSKLGSPVAVAKVLEGVIQIAKGKADITTLPEEAAHMFVSMLSPESPLISKMMKEIVDYKLYKDVVKEYNEAYNGDVNKLKLEAIGKLIGNIIVNDFTGETQANIDRAKNWFNRLWEVIKKILASVGLGKLVEYTSNNPSIFKEFADNIVNKRQSSTLAEAIVVNNFDNIVLSLSARGYLKKNCA